MIETTERPRGRSGGRKARRAIRPARDITMLPCLTRALPTTEVMDGVQIEKIDAASMDNLENVRVLFRDTSAVGIPPPAP